MKLDAHTFDLESFDPEYGRRLEGRIDDLAALGIEADLILFHAYDRWVFSTMDPASDGRYVPYATARLSAFANVSWSLANEFDLLIEKSEAGWARCGRHPAVRLCSASTSTRQPS